MTQDTDIVIHKFLGTHFSVILEIMCNSVIKNVLVRIIWSTLIRGHEHNCCQACPKDFQEPYYTIPYQKLQAHQDPCEDLTINSRVPFTFKGHGTLDVMRYFQMPSGRRKELKFILLESYEL